MSKNSLIILFDLDGTLIDSTGAIVESFYYAFSKYNYETPSQKSITSFIGYSLKDMFLKLGVKEDDIEEIILHYKDNYRKIAKEKTTLLPRAKEAILLGEKYATLGVVTTKTALYSREILEHLGVMKTFSTLIGFEDVSNLKPHPEPIYKALENLQHSNEEVWMIGDTQMDILAGDNAKVNSFGVLTGYESEESLKKFTKNIEKDALGAVEKIVKKFV